MATDKVYTITLPENNPKIMQFLKGKLQEYSTRVESSRASLDERLPNIIKDEIMRHQSPSFAALSVLSDLFYHKKITNYSICEEIVEDMGKDHEFLGKNLLNHMNYFGIIMDYVNTGGQNTSKPLR